MTHTHHNDGGISAKLFRAHKNTTITFQQQHLPQEPNMMISFRKAFTSLNLLGCLHWIKGFSFSDTIGYGVGHNNKLDTLKVLSSQYDIAANIDSLIGNPGAMSRRSSWKKSATILTGGALGVAGIVASPFPGHAAVGTLPEYADTNAIIQGITVNVADKSQQDAMIDFLTKSFDFEVLRKRIVDGVEDTVCVLEN
jgi:hypothetical protein